MAHSEIHKKEHGQPFSHDPDFNGPLKHRSCTDVICLLLFLVFIGCWTAAGIYAFTHGNPDTLLVPKDSQGGRCGMDSHLVHKPYLFFFDLTKCLSPTVPFTGCQTQQVCVENCPNVTYLFDLTSKNGKVWRADEMICMYGVTPKNRDDANNLVDQGKCARWYLPSQSVENRCVPLLANIPDWSGVNSTLTDINFDNMATAANNVELLSKAEEIGLNVVDDIINSWWKILLGLGAAMLVCIIYISLMRWIAGIMVWLSIIGIIALLSYCVYACAIRYKTLLNNPPVESGTSGLQSYFTHKDTWLVLLIISASILGIILLILVFLRKRILLAIALIREGSRAVGSVTSALFFPIFPWIFQVAIVAYAVILGLYLSTTGTPSYKIRNMDSNCICSGNASNYLNNSVCIPLDFSANCKDINGVNDPCVSTSCHFVGMETPKFVPYLQGLNVFGFFWAVFFISALGEMILAATFATWYWTYRKSDVPFFTVTGAILRTFRYHLGTLAFGSLIIAICRIIRLILEYIDHKLKKYDNEITKAILCCLKCFFWCLEKFLKFINRNAYIMCAIHGKNFCGSAKDAFSLLMRNILRVFVLDKVTDFLFFLSKLLITAGVASVAYVLFVTEVDFVNSSNLNYNVVPVIIIAIGTYFIAVVFFSVYTMAVDTLFLCFLEDCERNDGSPDKPYFMSKNLMKILGKKNKLE